MRIRDMIVRRLADLPEVGTCEPASTIYCDRHALTVADRAGSRWRVHVLSVAGGDCG